MFHRTILLGLACALSLASANAATLFQTNTAWKYFKGRTEASSPDTTAWRAIAFDDSTWLGPSNAPFYYGETFPSGTQVTDMADATTGYLCIFLRKTFVISNVADVAALQIGSYCDDGFVAWINGREAQRYNYNTPGEPTYTNTALNATEPVPYVLYDFTDPPSSYLVPGTNVIAVQVFNTSRSSSDIVFNMSLSSYVPDPTPPTILTKLPAPGDLTALTQITVRFSENVQNVDPDDLLINGANIATLTGSGSNYVFSFPQPPYGTVTINWNPQHNISDFGFPPNLFNANGPGATWQYNLRDLIPPVAIDTYPPPGVVIRSLAQIEVTFSEDVDGVNASDLLINNQPATNVFRVPGGPYIFNFPQPPPGAVQVRWATGHGITDFASPPNPFSGGSWSYTLDPNASSGDLIINEFMAANQRGITDENGDNEDWIEIYNRGSNTVNLASWSLSDDPDIPGLWTFPNRSLGPGQYLVVFASAKNRKSVSGTNHTNFRLGIDGEHLALYSPDSPRVLVHGFTPFPEQRNDHSYGYDSGGNLRYFATPTPGGPNGSSTIVDVCDPVHFSAQRGHYSTPFDLILSTPTPGAEIRYTRDGSEPTLASIGYTGPIAITNVTLIRAASFRPNFLPSKVTTHTYLYNFPASIRSLPIVSIVTASNNLVGRTGILGMKNSRVQDGDPAYDAITHASDDYHNPTNHGIAWERPASFEYIKQDNSGIQVDCGIRVQGSDYRRPRIYMNQGFTTQGLKSGSPNKDSKVSFRLYFRGDYGPGHLDYPLFTNTHVQSFNQLVLRGGMNDQDNPFIRDEWTRRIGNDTGQVTPHGNNAIVLINGWYYTNSPYYNPTERVHEEMLQSYHGGTENWDVISPIFAQSSEGAGVVDGDRNAYNALAAYATGNNPAAPSVYTELSHRMDLVNFIDYLLVNVYTVMGDWPQNNFRMGRDRTAAGIWRCYMWDAEWASGYDGSRTVFYDIFAANGPGPGDSGLSTSCEIGNLYRRLTNSFEFRLLWADRTHKHMFNGGALTDQNLTNRFYELRNELLQVLPNMNLSIATGWVPTRRTNMFAQLNRYGLLASSNAPVFSQFGGRVPRGFSLTMSNVEGTIYYTTNGADPRTMFTGAVGADARTYAGAITLNDTTIVKARSFSDAGWSAVTEAQFEVATLSIPVRITEIMYNPLGGSIYEFVELQNVGPIPLNLAGMKLDDAVSFTFVNPTILAPGATIVVANGTDPVAFASRYSGVNVGGYFDGNLSNGGERLVLKDAKGNVIVSVDYDDEGGWPTAADGGGYSLEIVDPRGDPDAPANWRASQQVNGTPGSVPAPPPGSLVRLNEILAENAGVVSNGGTAPDYIELRNTTAGIIEVSGWSLTDNGNPRKFVLPPGTSIPADGYLVLWCDSPTNTTPGLHTGLQLSRAGNTISLFDAATNRADVVTYGAQLPNLSIGVVNVRWQLNSPTPGSVNVAATTAAPTNLVINEWMANPPAGQSDWIELYNRGAAPISLDGFYISVNDTIYQINSLSCVGALGYIQLLANEQPGVNQLDLKLPAAGATITLYDGAATQLDRVTYGVQVEGVSQGRLPDGTATIVSFASSVSPGASNYVVNYTGPYLNEVLARNRSAATNSSGQVSDFIELYNPTASSFTLAGMSLSLDELEPRQWVFPSGTSIAANGYLVVWCNSAVAPSTNSSNPLNSGSSLDGESGSVFLFNVNGQIVNSVQYGHQVDNQSIGRIGAAWRLLNQPTPGATNSSAATLGAVTGLRVNEWMARPISGPDWFEIYNTGTQPIDLSLIYITDDLSSVGATKFRPPTLSFIGARGFVRFIADENGSQGGHHVNFSLDGAGESIRLYTAALAPIDTVEFGAQQPGVSQGHLPDGTLDLVSFPGSASPAESNYLLTGGPRINEVLSYALSSDKAVELYNAGAAAANVGGWYLSDSADNYRKYRLNDGTSIPAGGYLVLNESLFNNGSPGGFALNASRGGDLILSAADGADNLTGARSILHYGASLSNVSSGPIVTSVGTDVSLLSTRTLGGANSAARVGPIVISEIMYNPLNWLNPLPDVDGEYIELQNTSGQLVSFFDPANPSNTWRLGDAVEFTFPQNITLDAGERLLLVNFHPGTNVSALAEFRQQYGLGAGVTILGPYRGKLNNGGDDVELYQPGTPEPGGYVPQVLVDRVNYSDSAPWPAGLVDGGGLSLQRRNLSAYGNEPLNWVAAAPTPSAANSPGIVQAPSIITQPQDIIGTGDGNATFQVTASGGAPLAFQWRHNKEPIDDGTNATLIVRYIQIENEGEYDVLVSNPAGSAISRAARLNVSIPPVILSAPQNLLVRPGVTAGFNASARGSNPLSYRWYRNGAEIPGAISDSLTLPDIQPNSINLPTDYTLTVSNRFGTVSATATLIILVNPVISQQPRGGFVLPGDPIRLTSAISNTVTLPVTFRWRQNANVLSTVITNGYTNTFEIPSAVLTNGGLYSILFSNAALPTLLSGFAYITVVNPPQDQTVPAGTNVTLRAAVNSGTATSRYQWLFSGAPIIGATTTNLVITNIQPSQAGIYTFLVTNLPSGNTWTNFDAIISLVEQDTDGDGMPDSWEQAHNLRIDFNDAQLDADGDGVKNRDEYIAGTDPQNAQDYLKVDRLTAAGTVTIEFTAMSNKTYTVQYSDNLPAAAWSRLQNVAARTTNRVEAVIDPLPAPNRFYRLITPRE